MNCPCSCLFQSEKPGSGKSKSPPPKKVWQRHAKASGSVCHYYAGGESHTCRHIAMPHTPHNTCHTTAVPTQRTQAGRHTQGREADHHQEHTTTTVTTQGGEGEGGEGVPSLLFRTLTETVGRKQGTRGGGASKMSLGQAGVWGHAFSNALQQQHAVPEWSCLPPRGEPGMHPAWPGAQFLSHHCPLVHPALHHPGMGGRGGGETGARRRERQEDTQ